MKTTTLLLTGAGFVLTSVSGWAETTAASELERGVELMEAKTDMGKAIAHFEAVIRRDKESSRLAAEAWYYLAKCHLELDDKAAARRCVTTLREGWPADSAWVVRAGKLPLREGIFHEAPWESGELLTYAIHAEHAGEVEHVGGYSTLVMPSGGEPEENWTIWVMGGGQTSTLEFRGDDYRPIRGRLMNGPMGIEELETGEDGNLTVRYPGDDRATVTFATGGGGDAVYTTGQVGELVRVLPAERGATCELKFISPVTPNETPNEPVIFKLKVTGEETVEVPAGRFDCVIFNVETDATGEGETYWMEKDGRRRVVKSTLGGGAVTISLSSVEPNWNPEKSHDVATGNKPGSLKIKVPRGLVALPQTGVNSPPDESGEEQVALYDTKLRVWGGLVTRLPIPPHMREEMEAEGLSKEAIDSMVETMVERLANEPTMEPVAMPAEEVNGARKLIKDGGHISSITRLRIDRGSIKHERTLLITLAKDSVIMCYFDHETGAGEKAVELLKEIHRSLSN